MVVERLIIPNHRPLNSLNEKESSSLFQVVTIIQDTIANQIFRPIPVLMVTLPEVTQQALLSVDRHRLGCHLLAPRAIRKKIGEVGREFKQLEDILSRPTTIRDGHFPTQLLWHWNPQDQLKKENQDRTIITAALMVLDPMFFQHTLVI